MSSWIASPWKRSFDVVFALASLCILSPGILIISFLILTQDGLPILFRQSRIGTHGRRFLLLKFRSMRNDFGPSVTTLSDTRISPLGMFLRRWKLDELPQLFNVLKGDMSIVGPRPKLPEHTIVIYPCRPGLTSEATLAFIMEEALLEEHSADPEFVAVHVFGPKKAALDLDYVRCASFRQDLRLIANTIRVFSCWCRGIRRVHGSSGNLALSMDDPARDTKL